jgi:TonB family protein
MKNLVRRIAVYLICPALLLAATTSAQQNPIGGSKPVCTEKNPAPNCISVPHIISSPPPTYSEEARKAKIEGAVILGLAVDENGNPSTFRVISGLGMGLNERAIEAVKGWKFEPAFGKDGNPSQLRSRWK